MQTVTLEKAAQMLGVTKRRVYQLIEEGVFQPTTIAGKLVVRVDDITRYLSPQPRVEK